MRNPEDYISNMIELGGARNAFRDLQDDSGKTSVPITMEQFYDTAHSAGNVQHIAVAGHAAGLTGNVGQRVGGDVAVDHGCMVQ